MKNQADNAQSGHATNKKYTYIKLGLYSQILFQKKYVLGGLNRLLFISVQKYPQF